MNKLTAMLFSTLKKIVHIRYLIDQDTTKILIQLLIMSKLDYCNSILAGSRDYNINKLQRIQNASCRVIFNMGKYDSITPHLAKLHWLKIRGLNHLQKCHVSLQVQDRWSNKLLDRPIRSNTQQDLKVLIKEQVTSKNCKSHTSTQFLIQLCRIGPQSLEQPSWQEY